MPKIDIEAVAAVSGSSYPEPYATQMGARTFRELGNAAGLSQFGAVLVTLFPGDTSSLRHWHSNEDEFLWMIAGEAILVQDEGETVMRPGDCAGFRAGDPNGHHLTNRSDAEAQFLVVGSRATRDTCTYSDVDLIFSAENGQTRFTHRDGTPAK